MTPKQYVKPRLPRSAHLADHFTPGWAYTGSTIHLMAEGLDTSTALCGNGCMESPHAYTYWKEIPAGRCRTCARIGLARLAKTKPKGGNS